MIKFRTLAAQECVTLFTCRCFANAFFPRPSSNLEWLRRTPWAPRRRPGPRVRAQRSRRRPSGCGRGWLVGSRLQYKKIYLKSEETNGICSGKNNRKKLPKNDMLEPNKSFYLKFNIQTFDFSEMRTKRNKNASKLTKADFESTLNS